MDNQTLTNEQLWQAVLGELELALSKANFNTWFKNTAISLYDPEGQKATVSVPNTFTKAWLEKKYHQDIFKSLKRLTNNKLKEIFYRVELVKNPLIKIADIQRKEERMASGNSMPATALTAPSPETINKFGLNPKYTFDTFIVGGGNKIAHAACQAVAEEIGTRYNPLFIYGGVGLGKTHLLQAVGNEVLAKNPDKKILCVTCEKFTNDFVQAIRNGTLNEFANKYRNVDVLLIDDIQFMAGKDGTQEQFFHTFNELHQLNKQIILTSDRPPKAIPALEDRLTSRFEMGMIADISQPDIETRVAILKAKCREKNFFLDDEVIYYTAANIQNNIRELEGALNKLIAHYQFNKTTPNLENVKKILSTLASSSFKRSLTAKQLINKVSEFYDIPINDILGQSREKKIAFPRQIIMYLMREEMKSSYPSIGQELGDRDHTTAMHAHKKISREIDDNAKLRQDLSLLKQKLYSA